MKGERYAGEPVICVIAVVLVICRFLTTVERHLKNVTYGIGFQVVIETLPPLMNALRMVWIVSKHYNTDEKVNRSFVPAELFSSCKLPKPLIQTSK